MGVLFMLLLREGAIKIEKIKCKICGQTLLLATVVQGEIKCPRCKAINKIRYPAKGRVQKRTAE